MMESNELKVLRAWLRAPMHPTLTIQDPTTHAVVSVREVAVMLEKLLQREAEQRQQLDKLRALIHQNALQRIASMPKPKTEDEEINFFVEAVAIAQQALTGTF